MNTTIPFNPHDMNTRDYLRILFRHKRVVATAFLTVMSLVILRMAFHTPMYQANVKMLVSASKQVESPYYKELLTGRETQASLTQSEIVTSEPVLQRVVKALHLDQRRPDYERPYASALKQWWIDLENWSYWRHVDGLSPTEANMFNTRRATEELRDNVQVAPLRDTDVFIISVRDFDPVAATIIANVVSRSYVIFDLEQQMAELQLKYGAKHPMVMQLTDNIQKMTASLSGGTLSNSEAIGPASVKIIEQANLPLGPAESSGLLVFLASLFFSLALGVVLAFIFEFMDQTIKSPREVEQLLGIPFFGSIPYTSARKDVFVKGQANTHLPLRYTGAFHNMADQIHLLLGKKPFKTLLVATADSGDGGDAVIAHLGHELAEHSAKKVLIIEANYRKRSICKILGAPASGPGLVDVLTGQKKIEDVIRPVSKNLSILPGGQTSLNPILFLDSGNMKSFLEGLKDNYDLILVDAPELKSYQDGYLLAAIVDQTIFVVSENHTRRQVASEVLTSLKEHNASILGGVLNNRTYPIPGFLYSKA